MLCQAYDIHVRPLPNYVAKKWDTNFEEEHMRRMKDRKEWAKKNEQRQQARMKASKQVTEDQNIQQCKTTTEMTLLDKMLQELYTLNPEWEVRKKKAQAVSPHSLYTIVLR
jgi:acyl-CoA thioesterase